LTKHYTPEKKRIAEDGLILRTQVGSPIHGLNVKEQDDRDEMGICLEPPEYVIGSQRFDQYEHRTQPDHHRSGPGDLDLVVYSLRKWMGLALGGNPTVNIPLWVDDSEIVNITVAGSFLRNNRQKFLSKKFVLAHLGYLHNQRERMLGIRGGMDVNRPELVEQYGYDTKYAGHMVRLGVQGYEVATEGRLTLPMNEPWRSIIRDIRTGKYTQAEALSMAADLENNIASALVTADLPDDAAREFLEGWMVDLYRSYWDHAYGFAHSPSRV
jgi:hypothetical protein